jgi:uncharacterized protein YjiS (DUF1127 family)
MKPLSLIARCLRALTEWRLRAKAHRELWSLDAYMLRDLGLSHHAAADLNFNPRTPS